MKRVFFLLLILTTACESGTPSAVSETPGPRQIVEAFGERLQNVPLLAPEDDTRRAIRREYESLVTAELLQSWLAAPDEAPGRLTSSPWPARIEVADLRVRGGDRTIFGEIVEQTSTGETTRRIPVAIELQRTDNGWRISRWSPESAAAVIESYYAAIGAGEYERAYALWSDQGRTSGQTLEEFRSGFEETASVEVETGEPGRIEGAAGSRYVEIPVQIRATTRSGVEQRFSGTYMLRRSVVDGARPDQRMWRIASADITARR